MDMEGLNLVKSSFLPELSKNFDEIPLNLNDFEEYRKMLEFNLPVLYDFLTQQPPNYWTNTEDEQEFYAYLIILLCEVTARNTMYELSNDELIRHAKDLLLMYRNIDKQMDGIIFTYYQTKLHKNIIKRQYGAVNGFLRYVEVHYCEGIVMENYWVNFCLSVGIILRESVEPSFKQISTRIFQSVIERGIADNIKNLNIHSVIFDSVFKDVHFMDSVVATTDIWNCLHSCLKFFDNMDSFNWSYVDDLIETLLRNIPLTTNNDISICLLKFVTKLGYYFSTNNEEIDTILSADLSIPEKLTDCRLHCSSNSSKTPLRWAKSILELFVVESYKLLGDQNLCQNLLKEIHKCYMVYILPLPLKIIDFHLITFNEKFVAVLMESINIHGNNKNILKVIKSVLTTIAQYLQNTTCDISFELENIRNSLQKLLNTEIIV